MDLIIRNGMIFDGNGNPWFRGDVGVEGKHIVAVGDLHGRDIGLMVNRGEIDIKDYYELAGSSIPTLWKKYQPLIEEMRLHGDPKVMDWLEYLVKELNKEATRRGETITEYR